MTIDEFMRDIAPKMRPGYVAMDEDKAWCWFYDKPITSQIYNEITKENK